VQKKLASLKDVPFTLAQFKEFCHTHELLKPAFDTQHKLRAIVMGHKFWTQAVKKRKLLEHNYVFKNDFQLDISASEKFLDMPWKPKPTRATSEQNHSRGSAALIDRVVQKQEVRERRRSFSKDKEKQHSGFSAGDGLVTSPGDHPSLRKRRKSSEDLPEIDRTTKIEFQKNLGLTAQDLAELKKDVLAIGSGKIGLDPRSAENKNKHQRHRDKSRRRHSFGGGSVQIAPIAEETVPPKSGKNDSSNGTESSKVPKQGRRKDRRVSRRRSF